MATTRLNIPSGSGDVGKTFVYDFASDRMALVGGRTTFSNAAYTAVATDRTIAQTGTLSAARVVTLPAANAVPGGTVLQVIDESGTASAANTISWARAGSDTINGATANAVAVDAPYGNGRIMSDGTSKWVVQPSPDKALAVIGGRAGTLVAETAVTTKTVRWYNRLGVTITISAVYASVDTAPTGSSITVAVRKNSAGSNDATVTISAAANTGSTTGLALTVADGDYLQMWTTAVGSTVAGTDLAVTAVGTYGAL